MSDVLTILCKLNDPRLDGVYIDALVCDTNEEYFDGYLLGDRDKMIDNVIKDWFSDHIYNVELSFHFKDGTKEVMKRQ